MIGNIHASWKTETGEERLRWGVGVGDQNGNEWSVLSRLKWIWLSWRCRRCRR